MSNISASNANSKFAQLLKLLLVNKSISKIPQEYKEKFVCLIVSFSKKAQLCSETSCQVAAPSRFKCEMGSAGNAHIPGSQVEVAQPGPVLRWSRRP